METYSFQVVQEEVGRRLDRVVSERLETPRNQVQRWIRHGKVTVDGRTPKPSHPLAVGETVECTPLELDAAANLEPEEGALRILHEDPSLIVVDKPAGLVVHPGAGNERGTLVHRLLARFPELGQVGGPGRPGIVHRLDKDTSGVMVIARTARAYERLSRSFAEREVDKTYIAMVYGAPEPASASIETPIGRHPTRRREMAVRVGGRAALTRYRTLASAAQISTLEIDLATGRTHQIRVHLKSIGHPLIGDPVYGEARWKSCPVRSRRALKEFGRPALHSRRLEILHPESGARTRWQAEIPSDLTTLWEEATSTPLPADV